MHDVVGPADGVDVACSGYALDLGLERVRHALQLVRAACLAVSPQRDRDSRDIIDTFRLDQRLQHPAVGRQPVLVRVNRVVQAHDRRGAVLANFVLNRQHGHPGARNRVRVLDALDLGQDLLQRNRNDVFDIGSACSGIRNEDIGEGHVDLRLFLARRHGDREEAHQQAGQRQQRRDFRRLETAGKRARDTQPVAHWRGSLRYMAASTGSFATSSPSASPARISTLSP